MNPTSSVTPVNLRRRKLSKRRKWALLLGALLAWYELDKRREEERRAQARYYSGLARRGTR